MGGSVYITFDVECSMGGAWGGNGACPVPPARGMMGEYEGNAYGVPLICRILREHGLAATFFVEPFNDELGHPDQTEPVVSHLLGAGQDVQLHVHPNHVTYAEWLAGREIQRTDDIAALPPERQRMLIQRGAHRLAGWTGQRPVAFRAGNMTASEQTLAELSAAGIHIDSSYCCTMVGRKGLFADTEIYNGAKWYGDVLELALSGFQQRRVPGLHPAKPVDLVGISFGEAKEATRRILASGVDCVMILHSFSLFKVRNLQYDGGRPDRVVTHRFRRYCRWLADSGIPVRTFGQLAEDLDRGAYQPRVAPPPRLNRPVRAVARKAVQYVNNWYWT